MSDVWEMIFGAQSLAAGADTDTDGFSNLYEASAGTNLSILDRFRVFPLSHPEMMCRFHGRVPRQTI